MDFSNEHILVTGGAGFIGSNLVQKLLELNAKVTVLDNFATGKRENIEKFYSNHHFKLIEGDIEDDVTCIKALDGITKVSHQAALGSVPRSIEFPHKTHKTNATGFLNMIHACKVKGIKRFVFASSSSVYGDSKSSPKVEGDEGNLLSPYSVSKELNEQYAKVYYKLHQIETIGLRYFNVFGPNQDPNGVYAAAIPKFVNKMINGDEVIINGDGEQTRDFTFVDNAVYANLCALSSQNPKAFGETFNVACGERFSLNEVIETIKSTLLKINKFNQKTIISNGPERAGDIKHSLANISKISEILNYKIQKSFQEGMEYYLSTFK